MWRQNWFGKIFLILAAVLSISLAPDQSEAASTAEPQLITSAGAIQMALVHSNTLAGKKIDASIASEENARQILELGSYSTSQIQAKNTAQINDQWASQQVELTTAKVIHQTLTAFEEILQLEKQAAYAEDARRISETELALARSKETLGLVSKASVITLESSYRQGVKSASQAKTDLAEARRQFGVSLGIGTNYALSAEGVILTRDDKLDIDQIIIRETSCNPYIWYYEKQVDTARLALTLYDPQTSNSTYKIKDQQISKASYSLVEFKESLQQTLRSAYNRLLTLEEADLTLTSQLEAACLEAEFAEARFATGMISELARDKTKLAVSQLQLEKAQNLTEHQALLRQLQNPSLLVN